MVFSSGFEARYFFSTESGGGGGIGFDPFGAFEQRAGRGGGGFGIFGEEFSVHDHRAAVFIFVRRIGGLVGDVADFAVGEQQAADRFGIGDGIDFAFVEGETEFARRENQPGNFFAGIDAIRAEDAVGKNERRRSHSRDANAFAAQIFDVVDVAFGGGLNAKAAAMDAAGEFHVQSLLDRLEEIHHEMMRDVVAAEREHVLVIRPFAFHEADVEPFFLEEAFFDGGEDRRFAGEADIADADFCRARGICWRIGGFVAASECKDDQQADDCRQDRIGLNR